MRSIAIALLTLQCSLFAACESNTPPPVVYKYTFFTMGTQIDLSLVDDEKSHADRISDQLERDFLQWNRDWNPWGDGALAQLNQSLQNPGPVTLDNRLAELLSTAIDISRRSNGFFNPAVGRLVKLWGFDEADTHMPQGPPPPEKDLAAWRKRGDQIQDFVLRDQQIRGYNPGVLLDFGGFAKGLAVDKALQHLHELGVRNAIINAGGDLRAMGGKGNNPWTIGIRDPRGPGILASLKVHDGEAVFTSGDYERFYEYHGRRYHHIFDSRSGYPTTGTSSVTVVYTVGALADAGATALMVAGPQHWRQTATALGLSQVMLVASDGTIYITPELQARMQFEQTPAKLVTTRVDLH